MGSLGGHLLPGSFFLIFSIFWSYVTCIRYVLSKQRSPLLGQSKHAKANNKLVGYYTTVTMPCICLPGKMLRRAPLESYFKAIFGTIGLLGELITGFQYLDPMAPRKDDAVMFGCDSEGHLSGGGHEHNHGGHSSNHSSSGGEKTLTFSINNTQHITMYAAFVLGSIVELLMYYKFDLPRKADYVFGILAFGIEGFLFAFHLHSRAPLDIQLHVLLTYAIFGCMISGCLEFYNPRQILFTYGRILFTALQGTWFYHIGFVLYPPGGKHLFLNWDRCNHDHVSLTTMIFCWHVMIICAVLALQTLVFKRLYKFRQSAWDELIYIDEENLNRGRDEPSRVYNESEIRFFRLENDNASEEDASDAESKFHLSSTNQ